MVKDQAEASKDVSITVNDIQELIKRFKRKAKYSRKMIKKSQSILGLQKVRLARNARNPDRLDVRFLCGIMLKELLFFNKLSKNMSLSLPFANAESRCH